MSDKTLAEIWAERTERWPDEITRRIDVLWEERGELDDTVAEVVRLEAEHKYLSDELDKVAEEAIALRKENATLTADNAALRAKNEALEKQMRIWREGTNAKPLKEVDDA